MESYNKEENNGRLIMVGGKILSEKTTFILKKLLQKLLQDRENRIMLFPLESKREELENLRKKGNLKIFYFSNFEEMMYQIIKFKFKNNINVIIIDSLKFVRRKNYETLSKCDNICFMLNQIKRISNDFNITFYITSNAIKN